MILRISDYTYYQSNNGATTVRNSNIATATINHST